MAPVEAMRRMGEIGMGRGETVVMQGILAMSVVVGFLSPVMGGGAQFVTVVVEATVVVKANVLALRGLVGVSVEGCCWGELLVENVGGELSEEVSLTASLAEVCGGVYSWERTQCAFAVPVVMVGQPTVAPREAKTEVPAGAVAEVVVKSEVSGRKVVSEEVVMARA